MTRLASDDIADIVDKLEDYDTELISKTGHPLRGIACAAVGVDEFRIRNILGNLRVGVIPITSGEGIISGFCEAVKGILSHMGCRAFVTQATDVAGLAEAFKKKVDIILLSDDECFIALHTESRRVIDNAVATGKGFVAGLSLMASGLKEKNVLVIGCGPVGRSAVEELVGEGARVSICDIDSSRSIALSEEIKRSFNAEIQIAEELDRALTAHQLIIDATPAADIIRTQHITPDTVISVPGVPLGLDSEAQSKISNRLLHDPLQIGVATMLVCAMKFHIKKIC